MAMEGTKIPAGTLQPYEITTKNTRVMVARKSDETRDQRFDFLSRVRRSSAGPVVRAHLLAEAIVVVATFALNEQMLHAFGHIDSKECIREADDGSRQGEERGLEDSILGQVLLPELSLIHISEPTRPY